MPEISNTLLELILNCSFEAIIVVDRDGLVTVFNPAAERITGLKAADMLGKPIAEAIPKTNMTRVLKTGISELHHLLQLGGSTAISNLFPIMEDKKITGALAILRNVTKLKSLNQRIIELTQKRSWLEAILHATNDAITVVNEEGNGMLINPAYTKLTGLTESDVLGKPASIAVTEGESMLLKVLHTRQPVRGVRLKMGPTKKEVVVNVAPVIIEDKLRGSVGVIQDISEILELSEELASARKMIRYLQAKYTFDDILGDSEPVKAAIAQAKHASDTPATVLLRGESGTGKELFAHAIHNVSNRSRWPFVRVNCMAIVQSLLESELFGYEEGAFTGAVRGGKKGYFEEADGGTIFLDEIGDMALALQAKLLRVLQEKEIVRVGGTNPIAINVRVIAATNANLEQKINEGTFREDLYYRLNVVPIFIPPLRGRKEDIPLLAAYLCNKVGQEYKRKVPELSPAAIQIFMGYDWPGNVRELENVVGRSIINMNSHETVILPQHLPPLTRTAKSQWPPDANLPRKPVAEAQPNQTLGKLLDSTEKDILLKTLQRTNGNKTKAAKLLGIAVRSLYNKLEKHGLA
ncbi:MAG: Arginine utilization regulatory protein RocR [Pelotomaculum sp. PtaB.Bin104]|nr:MAG: Arginine utilization regulatory protein RocR [Pelotomaculum sp. PtaB.Bin104]